MKKNLLLTLVLFLMSCAFVSAQNYNEQDKEGLRAFLRQPSAYEGKLNLEQIGLAISDTINWKTSEKWVDKIESQYIEWDSSQKKRVQKIHNVYYLAGKLDCSPFPEITKLYISKNKITELNVLNNPKLQYLNCDYGKLSKLNVSKNIFLTDLSCRGNALTEIDLSKNENLVRLVLESVYYSNAPSIPWEGSHNRLKSLDLTKNTKLEYINVDYIELEHLDISNCSVLVGLSCDANKLTDLDVSNNTKLTSLKVHSNQLTLLDVSKNTNLIKLFCSENQLTNLDVTRLQDLAWLSCSENQLTEINVSQNPLLYRLDCNGNRLTSLDISKNKNLTDLYCFKNNLKSLDVSNNPLIATLWCSENELTDLDLTQNTDLYWLMCQNNELTELTTPNTTKLRKVDCNHNNLTTLDISRSIYINELQCGENQLASLDISKNAYINTLTCGMNKITSLDLSNSKSLSLLYCQNNQLKTLDLSGAITLRDIDVSNNELLTISLPKPLYGGRELKCSYNNFKFSTLYSGDDYYNHYYPQSVIVGGETASEKTIDLSSEYKIKGNITTYNWYDQSRKQITLTNKGDGLFAAEQAYEGQMLTCKMTNSTFPDLILEYQVKIVGAALQDHLQLNVNNNYVLSKDQQFKVFANVSGIEPDDVHFGLYTVADVSFVSDITVVSRKNSTYTCQIPSNAYNGSYMIAPYIYKEGKRVAINRAADTHFIDRLPFKVVDNSDGDIWGRSTKSYIPNQDITAQYMRANIGGKINELLEVEQDASFMINIGTSLSEGVRIGLFHLNGKFVTDITTKVNKSTYTCMVSGQPSSSYLVMPYIKQNGVVQVIEREAKSGLMDRLPIYVGEEDIWGRSATTFEAPAAETDVIVYLNNATNVVEIKGVDEVVNVEIYSLATGTLTTKTKVAASEGVSVQTLATGIYIVKVTTATGNTTSHKIKKD